MRILACVGRFAYGRPERGPGVEISTMVPAFVRLGHEVEIFDTAIRNRYRDYAELNSALVEAALRFRPELIFTVIGDVEIWSETMLHLRALLPETVMVSWATDDTWKYRQVSRFIGRFHHGMITTYGDTTPAYHADGVRQVLISQWAANEDWIRRPIPASDCRYQVSFVGIAYGDRRTMIHELARRGLTVDCFGHQWPAGPIPAAHIPEIMQRSVISLNFSKGLYGGPHQIKARTFEVPGAGGFLLTEQAPGLERWYSTRNEIAVWSSVDELASQIRFYLANPGKRDAMAVKAHERTLREHRYDVRMQEVISWAVSLPRTAGTYCNYERVVACHRAGRWLSRLRTVVESGLRPIIGRDRSRRYLRRLGFECAWRFSGPRAFSGSGWFGRAFPPMD